MIQIFIHDCVHAVHHANMYCILQNKYFSGFFKEGTFISTCNNLVTKFPFANKQHGGFGGGGRIA